MARIAIDATSVSPNGKGHSRTQRNLIDALVRLPTPHELIAFVRGSAAAEILAPTGVETVDIGTGSTLLWEQARLPRQTWKLGIEALLTLTDRLPVWGRIPSVVWLFELPHHRAEQNRRRRAGSRQRLSDFATAALWKRSMLAASRVVAGSQATARELARAIPQLAQVPVVTPGVDERFTPGPARPRGDYVFHLASEDPRDNTETVLEAFASAAEGYRLPLSLLIAGDLREREELLRQQAEGLGIGGSVSFCGRVSDAELTDLYRGARAYVDVPLYEGWGHQTLEAMACGAPVVASSAGSVPEVVGAAALLCAPTATDEIAAALVRVLTEPGRADAMREAGLQRAASVSWMKTAERFASILDAAASGAVTPGPGSGAGP